MFSARTPVSIPQVVSWQEAPGEIAATVVVPPSPLSFGALPEGLRGNCFGRG